MQSPEASGPGALAGLPSTLISVIATPSTSPLGLISSQTQAITTATQTAAALSQQQIQESLQYVISSLSSSSSDSAAGHVVAASGDSSGSTGKGILIGILSAFGSAAIAFVVLAIFFFFKYTRPGRIMLDRIGRPGEYDDEQAFLREEEAALETMDDLTRSEYLRAKGNLEVLLATVTRCESY
jgi:predicted PurR-regulated permease PerM